MARSAVVVPVAIGEIGGQLVQRSRGAGCGCVHRDLAAAKACIAIGIVKPHIGIGERPRPAAEEVDFIAGARL